MKKNPDYLGHRSRLRKKFLSSLGNELQDYELLEILLFAASARQDTKKIAKKLIAKFGDISSVISADVELLQNLEGVGEAVIVQIKLVAKIIEKTLKSSTKNKVILDNWHDLLNYANATLKNLSHEVFRVLFLDKKHHLLEDELVNYGESDYVLVSYKMITKKALILNATSVILLHNHPSGELRPSISDIKTTKEISAVLQKFGIKIIDHLIISSLGYFSFKEEGLL